MAQADRLSVVLLNYIILFLKAAALAMSPGVVRQHPPITDAPLPYHSSVHAPKSLAFFAPSHIFSDRIVFLSPVWIDNDRL